MWLCKGTETGGNWWEEFVFYYFLKIANYFLSVNPVIWNKCSNNVLRLELKRNRFLIYGMMECMENVFNKIIKALRICGKVKKGVSFASNAPNSSKCGFN